jgi:hypothetical protein
LIQPKHRCAIGNLHHHHHHPSLSVAIDTAIMVSKSVSRENSKSWVVDGDSMVADHMWRIRALRRMLKNMRRGGL